MEVLTSGKTKDGEWVHVPVTYECLTFLFILNIFLANQMSLLTYFLGLSLIKSLVKCLQHMCLMCHGSWVPTHIDLTCFNYNIVSDGTVASPQLTTRAYAWLRDSLRPVTQRTYSRMFADFLAFLVVTVLTPRQVNVDIILAFLEYLVDNSLSVVNICNYLAAPRTMFKVHNLPTHPFRDEKIQMFIKSVRINRPLVVIITEQMLLDIIAATETLQFSEFFSFNIPFGILFSFEIVRYGSTFKEWLRPLLPFNSR